MLEREALSSVKAAEAYLLKGQDSDGFWRDYALEPGAAEAWTTACVGWVLTRSPYVTQSAAALRRAADALHAARKPGGWGYNRQTAPDADSTAWAWRLLAALDDYRGNPAIVDLCAFLNVGGAAHTFRSYERFGNWALEHSDVTPMVGLALLAVGAEKRVLKDVRNAVLESRTARGAWRSFWWSTDAYATAHCLEFLGATGSIPDAVRRDITNWLQEAGPATSAFESAHYLSIAVELSPSPPITLEFYVQSLMDWKLADHAWPPSAVLLVPSQRDEENQEKAIGNSDRQRIMSTAMAVWAIKKWLLHKMRQI